MNPGKGEGWGCRLFVPHHPPAPWKPSVFPSWELEMLVGARTGALVVEGCHNPELLPEPSWPQGLGPNSISQS